MAKKFIKGKTYNTSTSYHIGTRIREFHSHKSDAHIEEYKHLYMRRKDDEYFIHTLVFNFNNEGKMTYSAENITLADDHKVDAFKSRNHRTKVYID